MTAVVEFLLVIFLTLPGGQVLEFHHPKRFGDIRDCTLMMETIQAMSLQDRSIMDAGCRSIWRKLH